MKKVTMVCILPILCLLATCEAFAQNSVYEKLPQIPSTDIQEYIATYDACSYGAKADGIMDDGKAIQLAIDVCAAQGGGIVMLKNGTYLASPLVLKSGVYLKIESFAVLKAISYQQYPLTNFDKPTPFISANNAANFGIFGTGIIDGSGADWWRTQGWQGELLPKRKIPNNVKRPNLIGFLDSSNLIIKDITLQNAPQFSIVPKNCDNVVISNVRIHNPANSPNTDGIDPTGKNIFIDRCEIDTGDDNIAIKAHNGRAENIYIINSHFYHGHGLSIGSDVEFGVQNVYAENCTFMGTETGIRIKSARERGGLVKNIYYRNITMQHVGKAIEITAYYPKIPQQGKDGGAAVTITTPHYQDIYISKLSAVADKEAGSIIGLPESFIENIVMNKVEIQAPKGLRIRNAQVKAVETLIHSDEGNAYIVEENGNVQF